MPRRRRRRRVGPRVRAEQMPQAEVFDAGGVRQQMPHAHPIGVGPAVVERQRRQQRRDRRVERELALGDQAQHAGGQQSLGHRADVDATVDAHGRAGGGAGQACRTSDGGSRRDGGPKMALTAPINCSCCKVRCILIAKGPSARESVAADYSARLNIDNRNKWVMGQGNVGLLQHFHMDSRVAQLCDGRKKSPQTGFFTSVPDVT